MEPLCLGSYVRTKLKQASHDAVDTGQVIRRNGYQFQVAFGTRQPQGRDCRVPSTREEQDAPGPYAWRG